MKRIDNRFRCALYAVIGGLFLMSCSQDSEWSATEKQEENVCFTPMSIDTPIGVDSKHMRVTPHAQWEKGDQVWIYKSYLEKKLYDVSSSGVVTPVGESNHLKWGEAEKETFYALYPNLEDAKSADFIFISNEKLSKNQIPILWARATDVKRKDWVKFNFEYKVAAVEVHLANAGIDLQHLDVSATVPFDIMLNLLTGELANPNVDRECKLKREENVFFSYLVPNPNKGLKLKFSYPKKFVRTYTFKSNKIEAGKKYIVSLLIDKDGQLREWKTPEVKSLYTAHEFRVFD